MIICHVCKKECSDDTELCPICGAVLNTAVEEAISVQNPSTDIQKRYKALFYQQKILDEIFNFYNAYEEHLK